MNALFKFFRNLFRKPLPLNHAAVFDAGLRPALWKARRLINQHPQLKAKLPLVVRLYVEAGEVRSELFQVTYAPYRWATGATVHGYITLDKAPSSDTEVHTVLFADGIYRSDIPLDRNMYFNPQHPIAIG